VTVTENKQERLVGVRDDGAEDDEQRGFLLELLNGGEEDNSMDLNSVQGGPWRRREDGCLLFFRTRNRKRDTVIP
jgi:hypothetical protein